MPFYIPEVMKAAKGISSDGCSIETLSLSLKLNLSLKNKIGQIKQQECMGGIKNIEEIFHARPLLIIVLQHDWQGQYHQALQPVNTIEHFHAKLVNTEYDVHGNKVLFFFLSENTSILQEQQIQTHIHSNKYWG